MKFSEEPGSEEKQDVENESITNMNSNENE